MAVSHVEYANGQRHDLDALAKAAQRVGAFFIVDATQSMGCVPIDAPSTGADAIVASGYKWLRGTFGAAVGYVSPSFRARSVPGSVGFRSHKDTWDLRADRLELPDDAARFESGTLHFGAALGLAAAVDEIHDAGIDAVWRRNLVLTDRILAGAVRRV